MLKNRGDGKMSDDGKRRYGTRVDSPVHTDLGGGAHVDYKNLFEVTVGDQVKQVLYGSESVLHFSIKGTPNKRTIDIAVDGLKKNDSFRVILDRDTREIDTVPYHGEDKKTATYIGDIKTVKNPLLADKLEAAWKAATELQPAGKGVRAETAAIITGPEAKALASIIQEIEGVANKLPAGPKLSTGKAPAK
jgi:hypothetical protein